MFASLFNRFKRSPRVGDGKDLAMSQTTDSPGASSAPDVSRQIAELTDAVNRLTQAQAQQAQRAAQPQTSTPDIGGEIQGGSPLSPRVDMSKLSPLQQITLGLRDAKPVGPAHRPGVVHANAHAPGNTDEAPPVGAD